MGASKVNHTKTNQTKKILHSELWSSGTSEFRSAGSQTNPSQSKDEAPDGGVWNPRRSPRSDRGTPGRRARWRVRNSGKGARLRQDFNSRRARRLKPALPLFVSFRFLAQKLLSSNCVVVIRETVSFSRGAGAGHSLRNASHSLGGSPRLRGTRCSTVRVSGGTLIVARRCGAAV